jgi:long-subunit fatty acid transport protein
VTKRSSQLSKNKGKLQAWRKNEVFKFSLFSIKQNLEKIHEKPYHQVLKENILAKVSMPHTFSVLDHSKNVFKSYELKNNTWSEVKDFNFQNCIGLGDITSTQKI